MISIVIPTYNEAAIIAQLVTYLQLNGGKTIAEIIVIDGGSDETLQIAAQLGAVTAKAFVKGRAAQMNQGAAMASGNILYFVHADTLPPKSFAVDIETNINNGFEFGRYCTQFDSKSLLLKLNAYFTKFNLFVCYGGDQTLFITKTLFAAIGGFNADFRVMEDYDITIRAKKKANYKIINKNVLVSARKYEHNSWIKVQKANYIVVKMFKKGASQQAIITKYKTLIQANSY
ncbi:MAG: TIGR04283 family arsenosugar biosynthesis glycosyltransferase [Deinococcales bacterium]|nr:TIGR04283 family arsenosugar biosynthesis glycosyltransferase [Chitinophagaceae bacterium]